MNTVDLTKISNVRDQLLEHDIYRILSTPERIRVFMEHHVFAVWDFMSLLKRLQQSLTCVSVPWTPERNATYARFINEIVLGEETDTDGQGGYISHFELYLTAMKEVGANSTPMMNYLHRIKGNVNPYDALQSEDIPSSVANFVRQTLNIAYEGESHEVAASFFFGREDIIPNMFTNLVTELRNNNVAAETLVYYLQRHIELDGDEHGPLSESLLNSLCENEPSKIEAAERIAHHSLQSRIQLWDGVLAEIKKRGI
jgi:hypothetical protein